MKPSRGVPLAIMAPIGAVSGAAYLMTVRTLTARAPTRIDFGGGWTDVPPYCNEQGGFVCCSAISRYATVELSAVLEDERPNAGAAGEGALAAAALTRAGVDGVTLSLRSDFPIGAGLGGSSAAGVAAVGALAAWTGESLDRAELAERSRAIEVEDLGVAGGRQDHYAAAFGGALGLTFGDVTEVRRLALGPEIAEPLARQCIVVYTGESRISGETITGVLDAYRQRDRTVTGALARMRVLAEEMAAALERGAIEDLGALVGEHWTHQRSLHRAIPTARIDAIIERARALGAYGSKALGASGGGCVLIVAPDEHANTIRSGMSSLGEVLPLSLDLDGFRVSEAGAEVEASGRGRIEAPRGQSATADGRTGHHERFDKRAQTGQLGRVAEHGPAADQRGVGP